MIVWAESIRARARLIHDEIAFVRQKSIHLGLDPNVAAKRLYVLLEQLYIDDLPLAQARDSSDLLLHIEGSAVEADPRLSLISNIFNNVKVQVRDLTKAISGILPHQKVSPKEVDLSLSGLARGSLYLGFSVPVPGETGDQGNLLGQHDTLYQATKNALATIVSVSHTFDADDESFDPDEVAELVEDPKIRDAALVAVQRIAPSGRQGVSSIGVSSPAQSSEGGALTPAARNSIRRMLIDPVKSSETLELSGVVREIDLDARRFDLRGIANEQIDDIRCAYAHVERVSPKLLLGSTVRVRGLVDRRGDHMPRLMALESIEIVRPAGDDFE